MSTSAFRCFLICALLLVGCSNSFHSICVLNSTNNKIKDVTVVYEDKQTGFGYIAPGGSKTNMTVYVTPPSIAVVKWTDSEENSHQVNVALSVVPKDYDEGKITFEIIGPDTVKAHFSRPYRIF